MTCEKYENALLEAASNGELNAKLARHLERCSTCRMTLRSERKLFSRIDSALRAQVNEDPRPRFLVQLRLQLSKELTARPGSDRVWYVAGAALALVAAFFGAGAGDVTEFTGGVEAETPEAVGVVGLVTEALVCGLR